MKQLVQLWNETKEAAKKRPIEFFLGMFVIAATLVAWAIWGVPMCLFALFLGALVLWGYLVSKMIASYGGFAPPWRDIKLWIAITVVLAGNLLLATINAMNAYSWFLRVR